MENISLIYYINFFSLALLAVFNNKTSKGLQYLLFLYLSLLVAIRYNVGNDYVNYVRIYGETSIRNLFENVTQVEYGSFGSMALMRAIGLDIPWWFFFMSMMTFVTLFKAIERFGYGNIWWAILIYYSFFFLMNHCNLVQHGAMTGWIWLAFSYIKDNNRTKFLIYCLIGASFHILGLFFIPFYWILKRQFNLKQVVFILGASIFFNLYVLGFLFRLLSFGYIGYKIQFYQEVYFKDQDIEKTISIGMIVYILLLFYLYLKKIESHNELFVILKNILLFSLFFQIGFKGTGIFDARIGGVFNISLIVIIPVVFNYLKSKYTPLVKIVMLLYAFMMFVITSTNSSNYYDSGYQFIPYQTILKY